MRVARGYHGTTLAVAEAIVDRAEPFRPSGDRLGHWLGRGIYFWEENEIRARFWANGRALQEARDGVAPLPAVIVADIDLSQCLDLCQPRWHRAIRRLGEGLSIPAQHGPVLRSARANTRFTIADYDMDPLTEGMNGADERVIDALHAKVSSHQRVTTKRGAFQVGRQLHSNSYLFEEGHVQIAVLDQTVITPVEVIKLPPLSLDLLRAAGRT